MNFFFLPNTKEDILKKVCNRLFWGTIDFHIRKKNYDRELLFPTLSLQNCKLSFFFYKISIFKKWVAYIELYENEIIIIFVFLLIHNYVVERG